MSGKKRREREKEIKPRKVSFNEVPPFEAEFSSLSV